jgi:hypothetical protein
MAGGLLAHGSTARAEEAPAPEAAVTWGSVAVTASGFATAFLAHEACHGLANLAMGNAPTLEPVRFLGLVPFFALSPGFSCNRGTCVRRDGTPFPPGQRGYATIVSAGLVCQELTDEIVLTARPRLREERAPFLKGMLLFNTATSVAYGLANLARIEPPAGDLRSLDQVSRVPHGVFAALIIGTAALDLARYFLPDSGWLPWVSRGSKAATVGLVVAF